MHSLLLIIVAALESYVLVHALAPLYRARKAAGAPHPTPLLLDDEDVQRQILDLIRAGNKIGATYLQQQLTGDGFNEARSTVESLATQIGASGASTGPHTPPTT